MDSHSIWDRDKALFINGGVEVTQRFCIYGVLFSMKRYVKDSEKTFAAKRQFDAIQRVLNWSRPRNTLGILQKPFGRIFNVLLNKLRFPAWPIVSICDCVNRRWPNAYIFMDTVPFAYGRFFFYVAVIASLCTLAVSSDSREINNYQ